MLRQSDFARPARGNPLTAMLHRVLERAQRVAVQFRRGKSLVPRETAAMNAFRNHHVLTSLARQINQRLALAQMLSAARHMDGDRCFLWREIQPI